MFKFTFFYFIIFIIESHIMFGINFLLNLCNDLSIYLGYWIMFRLDFLFELWFGFNGWLRLDFLLWLCRHGLN